VAWRVAAPADALNEISAPPDTAAAASAARARMLDRVIRLSLDSPVRTTVVHTPALLVRTTVVHTPALLVRTTVVHTPALRLRLDRKPLPDHDNVVLLLRRERYRTPSADATRLGFADHSPATSPPNPS
jgi:hypothetical protein